MNHTLEIRQFSRLNLNEVLEKVQHYQSNFFGLISQGKSFPRRYLLKENTTIFIYHTDKHIIVDKL